MSYDISLYIEVDTGGTEFVDYCAADIGNYTANVSSMWTEALGHPLADLKGRVAGDCILDLRRAVTDMQNRPDHYKAMNPSNGWGNYEGALEYLRKLHDACCAHPKAAVRVSH